MSLEQAVQPRNITCRSLILAQARASLFYFGKSGGRIAKTTAGNTVISHYFQHITEIGSVELSKDTIQAIQGIRERPHPRSPGYYGDTQRRIEKILEAEYEFGFAQPVEFMYGQLIFHGPLQYIFRILRDT